MDPCASRRKWHPLVAWLLIGNHNVLVCGVGPVDGVPNVLSSTQAALFGITAPNELLFRFMKYYKIKSTSKCVKCVANRAAISRVNQTQGLIATLADAGTVMMLILSQ
jgi:hypothetical protein